MKYIVNNKEVSRDVFYFCQKAKEENKTFVFLNINTDEESYINKHPEYDYYICEEIKTYFTKGEATVLEWYERDDYYNCSKCTIDDMRKRYEKSKFKDIMPFVEWYTKNNWVHKSETYYGKECHNIPPVDNFYEEVQIKLFSVKVNNEDTVQTINDIKKQYGDLCIQYVLRDDCCTEIIYRDAYKEI